MENLTTIYLIRHSTKFNVKEDIESYNTTDNKQLKTEKNMLTIEGEKRAEILSKQEEMQNLDKVYCSNYTRAMQTAKYLIYENNLKLNIDERFNERRIGYPDKEKHPDFFSLQYWDKEFRNPEGENQIEVNKRMTEAFWGKAMEGRREAILGCTGLPLQAAPGS